MIQRQVKVDISHHLQTKPTTYYLLNPSRQFFKWLLLLRYAFFITVYLIFNFKSYPPIRLERRSPTLKLKDYWCLPLEDYWTKSRWFLKLWRIFNDFCSWVYLSHFRLINLFHRFKLSYIYRAEVSKFNRSWICRFLR